MVEERVITVPLRAAYNESARWRTRNAMGILRRFLARHAKVAEENLLISAGVNHALFGHGRAHPPRGLKLKLSKEDEKVNVQLVGEEQLHEEAEPVKAVEGMPAEKKEKKQTKKGEARKEKESGKKPKKKVEGA